MSEFERPVGVAADVKELEYISALHQTGLKSIRTDGSLQGTRVVLGIKETLGFTILVCFHSHL